MTWRYCIQPLLPERTQAKLIPCGPKAQSADVGSIVAPLNCFNASPPTLMRLKGRVVLTVAAFDPEAEDHRK